MIQYTTWIFWSANRVVSLWQHLTGQRMVAMIMTKVSISATFTITSPIDSRFKNGLERVHSAKFSSAMITRNKRLSLLKFYATKSAYINRVSSKQESWRSWRQMILKIRKTSCALLRLLSSASTWFCHSRCSQWTYMSSSRWTIFRAYQRDSCAALPSKYSSLFITWKSTVSCIVIWSPRTFYFGRATRVESKWSTLVRALTRRTSSIHTFRAGFIAHLRSWWASNTHRQSICGLSDAFCMNSSLDSQSLQARMKKNRCSVLWKLKECLRGLW